MVMGQRRFPAAARVLDDAARRLARCPHPRPGAGPPGRAGGPRRPPGLAGRRTHGGRRLPDERVWSTRSSAIWRPRCWGPAAPAVSRPRHLDRRPRRYG
ncbi:MAG: hypothetical protein WKG07_00090 [Hymenobacter sp.]